MNEVCTSVLDKETTKTIRGELVFQSYHHLAKISSYHGKAENAVTVKLNVFLRNVRNRVSLNFKRLMPSSLSYVVAHVRVSSEAHDVRAMSDKERRRQEYYREFKITTTTTATGTSLNKRFNELNNGSARAL